MLGLLAILALSNSGGNSCRNCCPRQCCSCRELPTFVPARGTGEFVGQNPAEFPILAVAPTPGFLSPAATETAPLNVFANMKNVLPVSEGLEITRDGLYEISYKADVLFDQPGAEVAVYVQLNGTALFAQTGVEWPSDGVTARTAFNTARMALSAGDVLRLGVSVFTPGLLTIEPGATLAVKRIG